MNTGLRKFLCVGALVSLSVMPALAQSYPSGAATMGDINSGAIDLYQAEMRSAMSDTDTVRRDRAIFRARQHLAANIKKPLPAGTIAELDGLLDIAGVSPQLGATG